MSSQLRGFIFYNFNEKNLIEAVLFKSTFFRREVERDK
jgi:hypothetical protein